MELISLSLETRNVFGKRWLSEQQFCDGFLDIRNGYLVLIVDIESLQLLQTIFGLNVSIERKLFRYR